MKMAEEEFASHVPIIVMLQQFSLTADLKYFGKKGEEAVTSELPHMHGMEKYVSVDPEIMTPPQKLEGMNSLIFLTDKCDG